MCQAAINTNVFLCKLNVFERLLPDNGQILSKYVEGQSANCTRTLIVGNFIDIQKNVTGSEQDREDTELEKVMSIQS